MCTPRCTTWEHSHGAAIPPQHSSEALWKVPGEDGGARRYLSGCSFPSPSLEKHFLQSSGSSKRKHRPQPGRVSLPAALPCRAQLQPLRSPLERGLRGVKGAAVLSAW